MEHIQNLQIRMSPQTLSMVIAGEVVSWFWFSTLAPWGEHDSDRYFISAIAATFGLALVLQSIMSQFWPVRNINDSIRLAASLAVVYAFLECPHVSPVPSALFHFSVHVAHKFAVVAAMCWSFVACEEYYLKRL